MLLKSAFSDSPFLFFNGLVMVILNPQYTAKSVKIEINMMRLKVKMAKKRLKFVYVITYKHTIIC